ncbi:hypothetical protein FSP39_001024 [Pinctada imbricata]|uniref:Cytochrome c oxidase assembly protein COX15 homolog n=1 Tax=Pinctada imbricata TaxID=66713 RepID=A0AA89C4E6_PINIB|nr:hypothetical protein FSP39_001024 [Pinctada imbricata]
MFHMKVATRCTFQLSSITANILAGDHDLRSCVTTKMKLNGGIKTHHSLSKQASHCIRQQTRTKYFPCLRLTTTEAAGKTIPAYAEKIVGGWLIGCAGMCFGAVILGGVTRLTESGLSMVDWQLIKDMKPPGSQKEWEEEFERYKQYPEYKYVSSQKEMTLSDFKFIFYMEWGHRMWGRMVGMVFLVPAGFFLYKGWISKALKPRLLVLTGLLGFQGFLGWYMVKSGLQDQPKDTDIPRVSQYRLASHLGSAFLLYTLFLWQGLNKFLPYNKYPYTNQMRNIRMGAFGIKALVFTTALSGAFVAGLDAGLTYNSWPKMADRWIPDDLLALDPKWKNTFENPTTVQFNHRHLAESTVLAIAGFWWMCRKAPLPPRARMAVNCLLGMSLIQATLGITTLLTYVPTPLAASHQSGSLVLLSIAIWLCHELRRLPK